MCTQAPIPDALHSACSTDGPALAAFKAQAAKDWATILRHRAAELKPSGQLVVANFAVDDKVHVRPHITSHNQSAHGTLNFVCCSSLLRVHSCAVLGGSSWDLLMNPLSPLTPRPWTLQGQFLGTSKRVEASMHGTLSER